MREGGSDELTGRVIVLPEGREAGLIAGLIEARGGTAIACPMISIHDAPDAAAVDAWIGRAIEGPLDDLVLLTGEGLRRLVKRAEATGRREAFVAALAPARRVTRGPKPVRALREVGLEATVPAEAPTSEGVIATLLALGLAGRRVGVQLYPDATHEALLSAIAGAGGEADPVTPYVYASAAEDARVAEVIRLMADGRADAIAFTSKPQVRRMREVARAAGLEAVLATALSRTAVCAVGPVVAAELATMGVAADAMPSGTWFMKPLVREIVGLLGPHAVAGA